MRFGPLCVWFADVPNPTLLELAMGVDEDEMYVCVSGYVLIMPSAVGTHLNGQEHACVVADTYCTAIAVLETNCAGPVAIPF